MEAITFENNVLNVYNDISKDFDKTRYYVWNEVKRFLDSLPKKSRLFEAGCGNGKNMLYRNDLIVEGCDVCENFVNICKSKGLEVTLGDILQIPQQNESFDNVICVAVLHHLLTYDNRVAAVKELLRILKPGGCVYIEVWNKAENKKDKWTYVGDNNYLVKWKSTYDRYYHIFTTEEIDSILSTVDNIQVIMNYDEKYNRILVIRKIES